MFSDSCTHGLLLCCWHSTDAWFRAMNACKVCVQSLQCVCAFLPDECIGVVLHQCGLVHGLQPGVHVLLRVSTEVIRPHPSVLRLRANHRALLVNVRAHTSVASL